MSVSHPFFDRLNLFNCCGVPETPFQAWCGEATRETKPDIIRLGLQNSRALTIDGKTNGTLL